MSPLQESYSVVRDRLREAVHGRKSIQKMRDGLRRAWHGSEIVVRRAVHLDQSHHRLINDAQRYWNDPKIKDLKQSSHWRGTGIFADEQRWQTLGREHFCLYQAFARAIDFQRPPRQ